MYSGKSLRLSVLWSVWCVGLFFWFFFLNLLSFYLFIYLFIYLCLRCVFFAVCGLSLVVVSGGYSFVAVHRLLIAVVSLVVEHVL